MTDEERVQAKKEADQRQFVRQSEQEFEEWKRRLLRRLTICLRIADDAAEAEPEDRVEDEVLALSRARFLSSNWEKLAFGDLECQMEVFNNRKEVDQLCSRVLKPTLTRFMQS